MLISKIRSRAGASLLLSSSMVSAGACEGLPTGAYPPVWPGEKLFDTARKTLTSKDEFETSEDYKKQVAEQAAPLTAAGDIVVQWPLRLDGISYDADRGTLVVKRTALPVACGLTSMFVPKDVQAITFGGRPRFATMTKSFCFSQEGTLSIAGKGYDAQNAFGAKVRVTPISSDAFGIFIGFADTLVHPWRGDRYDHKASLFEVSVDVPTAKSLKENALALLVLRPVPPFHFTNTHAFRPTYSNPISGRSTTHYVTAAVQCVALADAAQKKVHQTVSLAHETVMVPPPER